MSRCEGCSTSSATTSGPRRNTGSSPSPTARRPGGRISTSRGNDGASYHHTQPFRRPRDPRIEPPGAAVLERKALVEQHDVVPLRALRFVHGQHVTVIEFVIGLSLLPGDLVDGALETVLAYRHFRHLVHEFLVRRQPHAQDARRFRARGVAGLHPPQPAIEQALLAVVA